MSDAIHPIEARRLIGPHEANLRAAFDAALARLLRHPPMDRAAYKPHAEASILNSLLLDEAKRIFADEPGVSFVEHKHLEVMNLHDRILLRFKRLDENLRTCNIPTHQAVGYSEQRELEGLPPATTKMNAGYQLTELRTKYAGLWITCPGARGILYKWSILGPEQGELTPPLLPEAQFSPQEPQRPVVRVKPSKETKHDDGAADGQD